MFQLLGVGLGVAAMALLVTVLLVRRAANRRDNAQDLHIVAPQGIQEGLFVPAGGISQWLSIRGEDRSNPVLLVLHGGPATSYAGLEKLFRAWEGQFTVVQWDRRGVGKTFGRNGAAGSGEMTLARIVADGIEIARFLCQHLRQERIALLGHSMGSMIGISIAARAPELLHAYVGTEQIIDMATNEQLSYRVMLERARELGDARTLKALRRVGPPPYSTAMRWGRKQQLAEKTDPAYGKVASAVPGTMWTSPSYTLKDLLHVFGGMRFCLAKLYPQWMAFDAHALGTQFRVPIFIIEGETDVMTPPELAKSWLEKIEAPHKEFVPIEGASHLAFATAAPQYLAELVRKVRPLAVEGGKIPGPATPIPS
jgi:pimeloyl-ACP methyl ester carboxylesterase